MKRRQHDEDTDAWLITYADMVTLLLCFFIILFSISEPNGEIIKQVSAELRKQGFYEDVGVVGDPYDTMKEELSLQLGASGYDSAVAISEQDDVINLELASSSIFQSGSAKFTATALPLLKLLSDQLLTLADKEIVVEIEGHTDDSPIATAQYPSNWELSASRASNVVRYFIAQGFPAAKLRAIGLSDTHPKAPNRDQAGNPIPANQELNRRVVIRLERAPR